MMSNLADLILKNATIITCDPVHPEADALAVKGDRILLIGSGEEVDRVKSHHTQVIDCQRKTLLPGFIDAHCHIFSFLRQIFSLDLSPSSVRSIEDIKTIISRKIRFTPEGAWINGSGYNEFYLAEKRHPTRWDLDKISSCHPVIITHRSRHACVLNSFAMQLIGITGESEAPPGGVIERDLDTGEPNGLLFEMLEYVTQKSGTHLSQSELDWGMAHADRHYLSLGITSLGEATVSNDLKQWHAFRKLKQEGKLHSRINFMPGIESFPEFLDSGLVTGSGDEYLRLGSLKIVLTEADGHLFPSQEDLNRSVRNAVRAGFQVAIHAVESSTVEAAIVALESLRKSSPISSFNPRHRIEHCSECPPVLRQRLSRLPAVIVSQPPFLFYHGERYLSQVSSETQQWLYPFKSLMDCGLPVAGSSDSPIVPDNPLTGICAAVTRSAENGQKVLASESVSAQQALDMYTRFAAYASLEESLKGTLSPGKLADIVMLSSDPLHTDPADIKDIYVECTVIGGKVVWEK